MGMLVETDLQVQDLEQDWGVSAVVDLERLGSKKGGRAKTSILLTRSIHDFWGNKKGLEKIYDRLK